MRFLSFLWCCLAVGAIISAAVPLAMSSDPPAAAAPLRGELMELPVQDFFRVYTQQHVSSIAQQSDTFVGRMLGVHDRHYLRTLLEEYATIQFNRRFNTVFDIVTLEMPRENIFVRSARTRQRIVAQLARESELAHTQIQAWSRDRNLPAIFLPKLEQSINLYRHYLASFTARPIEWINQAAHKLH